MSDQLNAALGHKKATKGAQYLRNIKALEDKIPVSDEVIKQTAEYKSYTNKNLVWGRDDKRRNFNKVESHEAIAACRMMMSDMSNGKKVDWNGEARGYVNRVRRFDDEKIQISQNKSPDSITVLNKNHESTDNANLTKLLPAFSIVADDEILNATVALDTDRTFKDQITYDLDATIAINSIDVVRPAPLQLPPAHKTNEEQQFAKELKFQRGIRKQIEEAMNLREAKKMADWVRGENILNEPQIQYAMKDWQKQSTTKGQKSYTIRNLTKNPSLDNSRCCIGRRPDETCSARGHRRVNILGYDTKLNGATLNIPGHSYHNVYCAGYNVKRAYRELNEKVYAGLHALISEFNISSIHISSGWRATPIRVPDPHTTGRCLDITRIEFYESPRINNFDFLNEQRLPQGRGEPSKANTIFNWISAYSETSQVFGPWRHNGGNGMYTNDYRRDDQGRRIVTDWEHYNHLHWEVN
ncbi:MAG: hypothetical protein IIA45_04475 [Bacteroidetes bacterium]|nr:hypothetical protein [Bacteroidota bacterium]